MTNGPVTLPTPLNTLVARSLVLCELMLPMKSRFYPFAATYIKGKVECVFSEDTCESRENAALIESLHHHLTSLAKVVENYNVLVFPTTIKTYKNSDIEVIAINTHSPDKTVSTLLYPYFRLGEKVIVSPPLVSPYV